MKTHFNLFPEAIRSGVAVVTLLFPLWSNADNLFVVNYGNDTVTKYDLTTGARLPGFTSPSGLVGPIDAAVSGSFLFVSDSLANRVGKYDATTGLAVVGWTSPLGLSGPFGLAISGSTLYVANWLSSVVGAYDTTTGAPIAGWTPPPASGSFNPSGLAISGNTLYVSATGNDSIRAYNALTGAVVSGFSPITGITNCHDVTVSGGDLYVTTTDRVLKYDAITGAPKSGFNFPVAFNGPEGLATQGNDLYVAYYNNSTVRKYAGTTGADAGWAALGGVSNPTGLAIQVVPEPGSVVMLGLGSFLFATLRRRKPTLRHSNTISASRSQTEGLGA